VDFCVGDRLLQTEYMKTKLLPLLLLIALQACEFPFFESKIEKGTIPVFDENLAYSQILDYEKFGPAIPGTPNSIKVGDWIASNLKASGASVLEQKASAETFDHHTIPIRNIIGQINPSAKTRYLLSAHWDARPFADEDPNPKNRTTPVPAVNDGGSGVVVLLGIANALKGRSLPFGVDFLFLDAEDWGGPSNEASWCLGTQYWVKHPIPAGYRAQFGINLDMVGRIGAVFPVEINSLERAGAVLGKIHASAKKAGYQDYFPEFKVGPVIDDHVYLMDGLKIPVVDLIHMTETGRFPPEWHTVKDTSEFISRVTLKAVGQTVLQVLWDQ